MEARLPPKLMDPKFLGFADFFGVRLLYLFGEAAWLEQFTRIFIQDAHLLCFCSSYYSMAIQTLRGAPSISGRRGSSASYAEVCRFWLAGRCNRNPCKFRHSEGPHLNTYQCPVMFVNPKTISKTHNTKRVLGPQQLKSFSKPTGLKYVLKPQEPQKLLKPQEPEEILKTQEPEEILKPQEPEKILKPQSRLCQYWASGTCAKGEKCLYLHSWWQCKDFTLLANLQGHKKVKLLVFYFYSLFLCCIVIS